MLRLQKSWTVSPWFDKQKLRSHGIIHEQSHVGHIHGGTPIRPGKNHHMLAVYSCEKSHKKSPNWLCWFRCHFHSHILYSQEFNPNRPQWGLLDIPSGKHTKNYGKSPFLLGKSTITGHFPVRFLYVYQAGYLPWDSTEIHWDPQPFARSAWRGQCEEDPGDTCDSGILGAGASQRKCENAVKEMMGKWWINDDQRCFKHWLLWSWPYYWPIPLNYAMIMLINHIMIVNQFEHTMVRYWQFEHDTTIIS